MHDFANGRKAITYRILICTLPSHNNRNAMIAYDIRMAIVGQYGGHIAISYCPTIVILLPYHPTILPSCYPTIALVIRFPLNKRVLNVKPYSCGFFYTTLYYV